MKSRWLAPLAPRLIQAFTNDLPLFCRIHGRCLPSFGLVFGSGNILAMDERIDGPFRRCLTARLVDWGEPVVLGEPFDRLVELTRIILKALVGAFEIACFHGRRFVSQDMTSDPSSITCTLAEKP